MKDKVQTVTIGIVLAFLCCYFMQILSFPNAITVVGGAGLLAVLLFQQKKIRLNAGVCFLTLAMVSYYVIVNGMRGLFFPIAYIPVIIYLLAVYCVSVNKNDKFVLWLIGVLIAGYTIHGILNAYMWYAGYVVPGTRRWQDFWTGEIIPGTQHTAYFLPILASFFPAIAYFMRRKGINSIIILATMFFGYTSLATRSRMSVLIFAITFCVQVLVYLLIERDFVKKLISNKKFWIACAMLLAGIAAVLWFVKDSSIVVAFIENMGKGGGILKNVRFEAQRMAIEQLFVYPMGGRLMELGRDYCHNTWLDMANAGGLIPFFAFAAYTVYTLYEMICLVLKKNISSRLKISLLGLYIAFFLYLSVEPAIDASIHLVTPWIFIGGVTHGIVSKTKG